MLIESKNTILSIDISTNLYPNSLMLIDSITWYKLKIKYPTMGKLFTVKSNSEITQYVACRLTSDNKNHLIHRLILPKAKIIDHKNGDGKDNRLSNLRQCTSSQNGMNSKVPKNSTSGITGITFREDINKWRVRISYNSKRITIGNYNNFEEAISARTKAEIKYHGNFRYKGN